jgi:hypothetical protein
MRRWNLLFDVLVLLSVVGAVTPSVAATTTTVTLTSYPEQSLKEEGQDRDGT